ncbi:MULTISPECIES: formate dehydrogenase subunit alpha [unclassified Mesorhizobium]|uniref:formate dehydrogenase subunit alpha n=3 Tax=Mesorhizobium TaxID=68287 RepID=UPI000FCB98CE|nr:MULTISPECIES: formate dehydrogenase subunit alpha [unclassified Mesorhizobium]RUZ92117.1 formate dehydrogenase [Mesorhizobium sp. M7A.F.Ca.US.003.02.2.1]RUY90748.1 formate dehydrogenase [Mesorhizobium sp. M7A.F.Ca.CA.001.12.2.1]RUZ48970.1 formate dehydrogenase [Mesorhizobium sp. M7A.F.Ca.US.003.02.1.1]RVA00944.1 formate dehydrogenase [Mesorhizobium sp. M7A.F.Ca.US.001.02.1.1]RVA12689.1 formate dehydrogenase [Mesorhizobium sp. M7A.F.Ca.US.002.01.1.1]
MLTKRKSGQASRTRLQSLLAGTDSAPFDRRTFLRRSGLAVGGIAALSSFQFGTVSKAAAISPPQPGVPTELKKSVCTHCAVGCTVTAEVQNGVWTGQEPSWDSPINRGSHCAKGASVRELVHSDRRLKYPVRLSGGKWERISWDDAINGIGDKLLDIREKSGPESAYWMGSAKFSNEGTYLFRKLAALWGTNNQDHQARICHSTTVSGVANTWGYGAMTNSFNDIRNSKTLIVLGGNPAEAHPVAMQHLLEGKELNKSNFIVMDPRFTRTAAHATEFARIRSGTDIAVLWGLLWHIFENGWEDKEFIAQRVYGMDEVRKEVAKYPPDEVERITGVPGEQMKRIAEMFATQKPSTIIWCMGQTHHTTGTANVRASCILCLATGNVGKPGTGANIFRGHDNVQGATDIGLDVVTLPFYYGLTEGAWKHWSRVWQIPYDDLLRRFDSKEAMETPGIPLTRWFDGVVLPKEDIQQRDRLRAMFVQGHASNSITRIPESMKGLAGLELLVVADPHPTTWASLAVQAGRKENVYLLPVCTQFETSGSRVASNRSLQWGEQIVKPSFEQKDDYQVIYLLAKKLGLADWMFKNIAVEGDRPQPEDVLREMNRGSWSTGYCGQSPERLKAHMKNQHKFDLVTLRAPKDDPEVGGDYYGLPWPCWGKPEIRHPGTANLYSTDLHVMDGGSPFRARFGVERNGETLLAEGSYTQGSELTDGYPEFTMAVLQKLGWDKDLSAEELKVIQTIGDDMGDIGKVSWSTDLSGGIQRVVLSHGCHPYGNGKARAVAWNLPDPVPIHREPIYTSRVDLVAKYPTYPDAKQFRLPNIGFSVQKAAVDKGVAKSFPIILTTGRLVEYEGGGEETRSNRWLAELQQEMFVEINPADAAARGIGDGVWVWVTGAENDSKARVKALVTERVGRGVAFMPFHFGGWFQGETLRANYPEGADPYVLGESANSITTYGYDPVTGMQEPKVTLCQIAMA